MAGRKSFGDELKGHAKGNYDHTHVSSMRKQSVFAALDTENKGVIDEKAFNELYDAIKADADEEITRESQLEGSVKKTRRRVRIVGVFAVVLGLFLAASVACNFAVMFWVVDSQVKTTTSNNELRGKDSDKAVKVGSVDFEVANEVNAKNEPVLTGAGSDNIIATRAASEKLPLLVAPMMDTETLDTITTLTVTDYDEGFILDKYMSHYMIEGYELHDQTYIVFLTSRGDKIHIQRAFAWIEKLDGSQHTTCANDVHCAAFTSTGHDAAQMIADARLLWAQIDDNEAGDEQPEVGWVGNRGAEEESRRLSKTAEGRKLNGWRNHPRDSSTNRRPRHQAWQHSTDDSCGGRRRLSEETKRVPKGQMDWSWMHRGPAHSAKRRLQDTGEQKDYNSADADGGWASAEEKAAFANGEKDYTGDYSYGGGAVTDMQDSDYDAGFEWASVTTSSPTYSVDEFGAVTCDAGFDCEELWNEYLMEGWMEVNVETGSLVCLVCQQKREADSGKGRRLKAGPDSAANDPLHRCNQQGADCCTSDPEGAEEIGIECTTCMKSLTELVQIAATTGTASSQLDILALAFYSGEVGKGETSTSLATREQTLAFFSRQYLDEQLYQYQSGDDCKAEVIKNIGDIGTWDLGPVRDLSYFFREVPPLCQVDADTFNMYESNTRVMQPASRRLAIDDPTIPGIEDPMDRHAALEESTCRSKRTTKWTTVATGVQGSKTAGGMPMSLTDVTKKNEDQRSYDDKFARLGCRDTEGATYFRDRKSHPVPSYTASSKSSFFGRRLKEKQSRRLETRRRTNHENPFGGIQSFSMPGGDPVGDPVGDGGPVSKDDSVKVKIDQATWENIATLSVEAAEKVVKQFKKANNVWVKKLKNERGRDFVTASDGRKQLVTSRRTPSQQKYNQLPSFNADINGWATGDVRDMQGLFRGMKEFNSDLSKWDTSQVVSMDNLFAFAKKFNGDVTSWDTSKTVGMSNAFHSAKNFNQDISGWDTSSVNSTMRMFDNAVLFNRDINAWDTSSVTAMDAMFKGAAQFDYEMSSWDVCKIVSHDDFAMGTNSWQPEPTWGMGPECV